jgi:hypothetical protein
MADRYIHACDTADGMRQWRDLDAGRYPQLVQGEMAEFQALLLYGYTLCQISWSVYIKFL